MKLPMYTYYAGVTGTPTALAAGGDSEVYVIAYGHANHTGELGQMGQDFLKKFNDDYYTYATYNGIQLLGAAMAKAKSTNPMQVAKALEGIERQELCGRCDHAQASDHQLQQSAVRDQVAEGQEG
jgi:branched-chain amino acid transport system substrate-binding protein